MTNSFRSRRPIFLASLVAATLGIGLSFVHFPSSQKRVSKLEANLAEKTNIGPQIIRSAKSQSNNNFSTKLPEMNGGLLRELESQLSDFREEGDTIKLRESTIVKVDPENRIDHPKLAALQEAWKGEVVRFLSQKLRLSQHDLDAYQFAYDSAFAEYEKKTEEILEPAKAVLGPDIALLQEGKLQILHDQALKAYENQLKEIMGSKYEQYNQFREDFSTLAMQRAGFVPSFVR